MRTTHLVGSTTKRENLRAHVTEARCIADLGAEGDVDALQEFGVRGSDVVQLRGHGSEEGGLEEKRMSVTRRGLVDRVRG